MNPPPALLGAMNRDRKPFTYTPGGLDLSEIKSERMAKRLMRNAMNQGVPEVPTQQVQSPPANPIAVPNFNCLPVQVFPTFNLPANPKSLLRTRSHPDNPNEPIQKVNVTSQIPKATKAYNNSTPLSPSNNNNFVYQRPVSMYEKTTTKNGTDNFSRTSYSSTEPAPLLPEICYEAEYFQTAPIKNVISNEKPILHLNNGKHIEGDSKRPNTIIENISDKNIVRNIPIQHIDQTNINSNSRGLDDTKGLHLESDYERHKINYTLNTDSTKEETSTDVGITPISAVSKPIEENLSNFNDEQKEVKVVKKLVKKETKSEVRNGEQNGDNNAEAELTVKLPAKKTAAKTETNVEVVKQELPDGSVKEIKTTTTTTTLDGKTTIATKTETKITPKEVEVEEEVEEEEEEEEEEQSEVKVQEAEEKVTKTNQVEENTDNKTVENGVIDNIITNEERSETKTTKKVTIVQSQQSEEEDEVEEVEEEEETEVTKANTNDKQDTKEEVEIEDEDEIEVKEPVITKKENVIEKEEEVEEEEEDEETEDEIISNNKETKSITKTEEDEQVVEEEDEEVKEEIAKQDQNPVKPMQHQDTKEDEESEYTEEEYESEKEDATQSDTKVANEVASEKSEPHKPEQEEEKSSVENTTNESLPQATSEASSEPTQQPTSQPTTQPTAQPASQPEPQRAPHREPSIPLEKVEDIEIKPIGPVHETITKTHSENTEITRTERPAAGPLSTQTEYNRVENIVTVNRTTKTLDQSYENLTQHGVPTVKTYFAPNRERVSTSPQPSKPFQPNYSPTVNQPTERRHSLLLERLSMERQLPTSDIYQNNYQNQSLEQQRQWSQEPQAEVLTVSNVKPSTITNQQWYQQSKKENIVYNNTTPTVPVSQPWSQAAMPQQSPQPQQPPHMQYQPIYTDSHIPSSYQQNDYDHQGYKTKPTWESSLNNTDTTPSNIKQNEYSSSFLTKNSNTESIHKTSQQYSSSYVPPPWEQDSNYLELSGQNECQPPSSSVPYSSSTNQGWTPTPPKNKFTKPPPTSYIPPAPNQSFVKHVSNIEPPRVPGKKTYYSEYERRYITVPESTYIPGETKYQPQPDPSPQYYYDNNEPSEPVEPQWRKELREFTEKTSHYSEQVSVKPPWEEDPKYAKAPSSTYMPTPTWSQTLRPRSWRERSFESEFVGSQNAPKNNTLGRGRPLSSYGRSNVETIPERPRGVSVDRYNPNNYQSPLAAEHPPVQSHVLNVVPPAKGYHNPNVPAYHTQSRASAEPREQSAMYQNPRHRGEARASPIQSRSFKYLQWITGTDN